MAAPDLAEAPPPWYERHWHALAVGIVLAAVLVGLSLVSPAWLAGHDAVKYVDAARSLARGEGYLFNGGREAKHPPGLPALLVPLFWLTSDPLLSARVMIVLSAGVSLLLAGRVLRRVVGPGVSLLALLCTSMSVELWWSTQSVLSEYPYAVWQNLALGLLIVLTASETPRRRDALMFGAVTAAAILTRPIAVVLVAAFVYVIFRRWISGRLTLGRAFGLVVMAVGVPLIAFAAWRVYTAIAIGVALPENVSILVRGYGDGASLWAMIAGTVRNLVTHGGGLIVGRIAPSLYPSIAPLLWAGLLVIWLPVLIMLVLRGVGRAEPLWVFLCIYLTTVAMWPLAGGATARLCWPIAPYIAAAVLSSSRWLARTVRPRRGPALVTAVIVAGIACGQLASGRGEWREARAAEAAWTARRADLVRVRERFHPTPPAVWANLNVREAVYVFDMSTTVMEFTWRKDPERWRWELQTYRPDYVVVPTTPAQIGHTERFLDTLITHQPEAALVAQLDTIRVYRIPWANTG